MPKIAAIVDDLFFSARLGEAAGRAGLDLNVISAPDRWPDVLATEWDFVLVSTLADSLPWERWIGELKARPQPPIVIAFGPHLQLARRERALAAGADRFVANSAVMTDLGRVLRERPADRP